MDTRSNKYVVFEIMVLLIEKKPPKPSEKLKKKSYFQLVKKPPKLNKKIRKKTEDSQLIKNLLNLIREQKRKPIICCFVEDEKPSKPSKKNEEKNRILIENKDKGFVEAFNQKFEHNIYI